MTILRVALVAACVAVLLGRPSMADGAAAETAAKQAVEAPAPASMPLPPPLPPAKTAVAAVNG